MNSCIKQGCLEMRSKERNLGGGRPGSTLEPVLFTMIMDGLIFYMPC